MQLQSGGEVKRKEITAWVTGFGPRSFLVGEVPPRCLAGYLVLYSLQAVMHKTQPFNGVHLTMLTLKGAVR